MVGRRHAPFFIFDGQTNKHRLSSPALLLNCLKMNSDAFLRHPHSMPSTHTVCYSCGNMVCGRMGPPCRSETSNLPLTGYDSERNIAANLFSIYLYRLLLEPLWPHCPRPDRYHAPFQFLADTLELEYNKDGHTSPSNSKVDRQQTVQ